MELRDPSFHGRYILDGHVPVPCSDLGTWATFMQEAERHVASEYIGDYWISTVFLGVDHNYAMQGPAILFETMIFDRSKGERYKPSWLVDRYTTWGEAEAGHALAIEKLLTLELPEEQENDNTQWKHKTRQRRR